LSWWVIGWFWHFFDYGFKCW